MSGDGLTRDRLRPWDLWLWQGSGFRYGLDAMLLASAVEVAPGETGVELGAGTGVVSLVLSRRERGARLLLAVELDEEAALLAARNVRENGPCCVRVVRADYAALCLRRPTDLVYGNPPYWRKGSMRLPRDPRHAAAKCELKVTLEGTVAAAARLLRPGGRLYLILPAAREGDLRQALERYGLSVTRERRVVRRAGKPPGFLLVRADKGAPSRAPIVDAITVLDAAGRYTDEAARAYGFADARAMGFGGRAPAAPPLVEGPC